MENKILSIGKKIRLYRIRNGLTVDEFAERVNVSRQMVIKWEHGDSVPKLDTAIDIAKVLNIDLKDLAPSKEEISFLEGLKILL